MARGENLLDGFNVQGIDLISEKVLQKYFPMDEEKKLVELPVEFLTFKSLKDLEKNGYKKEGTGFYRDAEHHLWKIEKDNNEYKLFRHAEEEDNLKQSKLASKKAREWRLRIDVSEPFNRFTDEELEEDDTKFLETRDSIVEVLEGQEDRIQRLVERDQHFNYVSIVEDFKHVEDLEEFNDHWERLYDWADANSIWLGTTKFGRKKGEVDWQEEVVENAIEWYKKHIERAKIVWDEEDLLDYVIEALADEAGVDVENIDVDSTKKLIGQLLQKSAGFKESLTKSLKPTQIFKSLKDLEKNGYKKEGTGFYRDAEHHLWKIEKDNNEYKLFRHAEEEDNLKQSKLASKKQAQAYPPSDRPSEVGTYPALVRSGGGYVWDEILEYRVWVHSGGDDHYAPFATYDEANDYSRITGGAEEPQVLVLQNEYIDVPYPGEWVLKQGPRIAEWQPEWLEGSKSTPELIESILKGKHGGKQSWQVGTGEEQNTYIDKTEWDWDDLVDIVNSRLGWAVAAQFKDILEGEQLENQNSNALREIVDFLRRRKEDEARIVADEIQVYLDSMKKGGAKQAEFEVGEEVKTPFGLGKIKSVVLDGGKRFTVDVEGTEHLLTDGNIEKVASNKKQAIDIYKGIRGSKKTSTTGDKKELLSDIEMELKDLEGVTEEEAGDTLLTVDHLVKAKELLEDVTSSLDVEYLWNLLFDNLGFQTDEERDEIRDEITQSLDKFIGSEDVSDRRAVAPSGWEHVVEKIKEYERIKNPDTFVWWLKEKGYKPKVGRRSEKEEKEEYVTLSSKKDLDDFWDDESNQNKEIYFAQIDVNAPEENVEKGTNWLVGSQTFEDYTNQRYWEIDSSGLSMEQAIDTAKQFVSESLVGIYTISKDVITYGGEGERFGRTATEESEAEALAKVPEELRGMVTDLVELLHISVEDAVYGVVEFLGWQSLEEEEELSSIEPVKVKEEEEVAIEPTKELLEELEEVEELYDKAAQRLPDTYFLELANKVVLEEMTYDEGVKEIESKIENSDDLLYIALWKFDMAMEDIDEILSEGLEPKEATRKIAQKLEEKRLDYLAEVNMYIIKGYKDSGYSNKEITDIIEKRLVVSSTQAKSIFDKATGNLDKTTKVAEKITDEKRTERLRTREKKAQGEREEEDDEWEDEDDSYESIDTGDPDFTPAYWNSKGEYQKEYDALWDKLVPSEGEAETIPGEVLRAISRIYYDRYNNGFGNGPWADMVSTLKLHEKNIKQHMNPEAFDTFMKMFEDINYGERTVVTWEGDPYMEEVVSGVVKYVMDEEGRDQAKIKWGDFVKVKTGVPSEYAGLSGQVDSPPSKSEATVRFEIYDEETGYPEIVYADFDLNNLIVVKSKQTGREEKEGSKKVGEFRWNEEIDYRYYDEPEPRYITSGTAEYALLDNLEEDNWVEYLDVMAGSGVTVEYDTVEDYFVVYGPQTERE